MARIRRRATNPQQQGEGAPRGLKRAMRGLQGFAGQAAAAYGKLTANIEKLIPSVRGLGRAWGKMRDAIKESIPHIDAAANAIMRTRYAIATTIPLVSSMATQFAGLAAAMRAAGMIGQSSMTGLAASTLKASAATGALGSGLAAALAPIAAIAAAAGLAYVAIFKWDELPLLLKAFLVAASPLVMVIRAIALAWNVATAPIRIFRAGLDGIRAVVRGAVAGVVSLVEGVGKLAQSLAGLAARGLRGVLTGLASMGSLAKRALVGISDGIVAIGASLGKAGGWLSGLAGQVVDPLKRAADEFAKAGTAALALAGSAGLAVDQLTALGYAAEQVGSDAESVAAAVENMNAAVAESSPMIRRLGLDVGKLSGMSAADRFEEIGVAIAGLADPLERAAAAQEIFGSGGEQLVAMFAKGKGGLADMRREAERLGLVMGKDAAESGKALADATRGVQSAMTGLWRTLGAAVAPQLAETAKNTIKLVSAVTQWAAKNGPLIAQVFKVASTVAAVGASLTTVAGVLTAVTPGVVALTGALAVGWLAWGKYGQSATDALNVVLPALKLMRDEAYRVLGGVWDAIQGGDLELAVQIAWLGAQKAWVEGLHALAGVTSDTLGGIFEALAAGDWRSALSQAWIAVQELATQGLGYLDDVFTGLTNTIDSAITAVRQGINIAISELANLAIKAMGTVSDVASKLAQYDPTGRIERMQIAAAKAMKGSALFDLAGSPQAANDALAEDSRQRGFGRLQDLLGRQNERTMRLSQLSGERAPLGATAEADAATRRGDVRQRLDAALDAARRARENAQRMQGVDVDQRNRLAGAAAAATGRTSTAPAGATFSGAALLASGGANGVQREIATNTRVAARALTQLVEADKKREKEQRAMALIPVA